MNRKMMGKNIRVGTAWLMIVLLISVYFGNALAPAISQVAAETRASSAGDKGDIHTGSNVVATSSDAVLEVCHAYPDINEEDGYRRVVEKFTDIALDTEVTGMDYAKEAEGWLVDRIEPETLKMAEGINELTVYYLDEQSLLNDLMMMSVIDPGTSGKLEGTAINPGEAKAVKTAEWTDYAAREAKITLRAKSRPVFQGVDVLLLIDQTGSMKDPFKSGSTDTKIEALEDHAHEFVRDLLSDNSSDPADATNNRVGIIGFYGIKNDPYPPITFYTDAEKRPYYPSIFTFYTDSGDTEDAVDNLISAVKVSNGGTCYDTVLKMALDELKKLNSSRPTYVVMMTDGAPDEGVEGVAEADALKAAGYPLITFGVGIDGLSDPAIREKAVKVLRSISSQPYSDYCLLASDTQTLHESLQRVLTKTVGAASNMIIKDEINTDKFEIKPGWDPKVAYPDKKVSVTTSGSKVTVTWSIGTLMSDQDFIEIPLVLKDNWKNHPGVYDTNDDVELTYSKYKEDGVVTTVPKEEIGEPALPVHGAMINIRYLLSDDEGRLITPEGNYVQSDEVQNFAHVLFREYVSGNNTIADIPTLLTVDPATGTATYNYNAKQTYTAGGKNYVLWDSANQFNTPISFSVEDGKIYPFVFYMYETLVDPDPDLITLSVKSPDASWKYDGEAHKATDYTVTGLENNDYIESGIVLNAEVTNVSQGKVTNAITIDKTNLVIKSGDGSGTVVTDQYDIDNITIEKEGELSITPLSISLQAPSKEEQYVTGKVLTAPDVSEKNLVKGTALAKDQTLSAKATGSLDKVGEIDNPIDQTSVKIFDKSGNEVAMSLGNYTIEYLPGKLKMTQDPPVVKTTVTITPQGGSWEYDGKEHKQTDFTQMGLKPGHHIEGIAPTTSVTDVADSGNRNRFDETQIRIVDKNGKDVTAEYNISMAEGGLLNVTARRLVLQADSKTETYAFGKVVTAPGVSIADGTSLAEGHTLTATAIGQLAKVDKIGIANPIDQNTVLILAGTKDVTKNYAIEYRDGVLIMNPKSSGGGGGGGGGGDTTTPTKPDPGTTAPDPTPTPPSPVDPDNPATWPDAGGGGTVTPTPVTPKPDGSTDVVVPSVPPQTDVVVRDKDNNVVWKGSSDDAGNINVTLPPGDYVLIAIDDENVPLAEMMFTIPDSDTPLAGLPKTGDGVNTYVWMICLVVSGCALWYGQQRRLLRLRKKFKR